jgi:hypothetical protein
MNLNLEIAVSALLLSHFIGDALLQSREMAERKSSDLYILFTHIAVVSFANLIFASIFFDSTVAIKFTLLNAIGHLLIDGLIWNAYKFSVVFKAWRFWRKNKDQLIQADSSNNLKRCYTSYLPKFKYWKDKNFYTFIVLDQMLHIACFVWALYLSI